MVAGRRRDALQLNRFCANAREWPLMPAKRPRSKLAITVDKKVVLIDAFQTKYRLAKFSGVETLLRIDIPQLDRLVHGRGQHLQRVGRVRIDGHDAGDRPAVRR